MATVYGFRAGGLGFDSRPKKKHKNLGGRRGPSDYVNFRRAAKIQRFHTLKHTVQRQEQHKNISYKHYKLEQVLVRFPTDVAYFLPIDQ